MGWFWMCFGYGFEGVEVMEDGSCDILSWDFCVKYVG